jgi:type IV pilus assembly protein PilB
MNFANLKNVRIPESVLALLPESAVRENCVLPLAFQDGVLVVAIASGDARAQDALEKLAFILNWRIEPVLADRDDLLAAIDRHYRVNWNEHEP